MLHAIVKFGIITAVPLDGEISYEHLAQKVGLTERQVRRILRHAMTKRYFTESRSGFVAHTSLSAAPYRLPELRAWIEHNIDDHGPASCRMIEAIEKWGDSQDPHETGYSLAFGLGENENVFTFFENDGEGEKKGWRARRFGQAMSSMTAGGAHDVSHIRHGFMWKDLDHATIVDVRTVIVYFKINIYRIDANILSTL